MSGLPNTYNGKPYITAWIYLDKQGNELGAVARYQNGDDKKDIVPFFKRNGSNFIAGIDLNPRPLFGLYELANHPKDKAVFVTEGEKSTAALQGMGICAVTSIGGASAAKLSDWTPLNGFKSVYLLPDNNQVGEDYMRDVYRTLIVLQSPPDIKVLRFDGLPDGGDIVDWLQGWIANWDGYAPMLKTYTRH